MSDLSTVGGRLDGADLELFDNASGDTVMAYRSADASNPAFNGKGGITALAGGGQTNAVLLSNLINQVNTVGTAADSVKLPAAKAGTWRAVTNAAATNSMNVFPSTGDTINALSANAALAVAAGKTVLFVCPLDGAWYSILSA